MKNNIFNSGMTLSLIKHSKVQKKQILPMLCMMVLFFCSWAPMMFNSALSTDFEKMILHFILYCLLGVIILLSQKNRNITRFTLVSISAMIIYRFINLVYAFEYQGLAPMTIVIAIVISLQPNEVKAKAFIYFKYVMVIVSILSLICYIAFYIGFSIPHDVIVVYDFKPIYRYYFFYIMNWKGMLRCCGLFDEPGWFGTWLAFYLCADDLNLKKLENKVLLVAGLSTLSLAFILLVILYFLIKNCKEWKKIGLIVLLFVFYLFVLPNIKTGIDSIDHVLGRMIITENGLIGNNRTGGNFEKLFEKTIHSNKVFLGYGAGYSEYFVKSLGVEDLASIKAFIVNFGFVGTLIIFLPLFLESIGTAISQKNELMFRYVLITFVSLYQRPYLFWPPYFIIFICGMAYTSYYSSSDMKTLIKFVKFQ